MIFAIATYTYDDFGRLIDECRVGASNPYHYSYACDPNGNRVMRTAGSTTGTYFNDADSKLRWTNSGWQNASYRVERREHK